MAFDPREFLKPRDAGDAPTVPLGGTRAERLQRLQVGVFGIVAMVLVIGLADAVTSRMNETDATAVPEAAPTVMASETAAPRDPLVDAGVAPELPAVPTESPVPTPTGDVPPGVSPTASTNAPLQ